MEGETGKRRWWPTGDDELGGLAGFKSQAQGAAGLLDVVIWAHAGSTPDVQPQRLSEGAKCLLVLPQRESASAEPLWRRPPLIRAPRRGFDSRSFLEDARRRTCRQRPSLAVASETRDVARTPPGCPRENPTCWSPKLRKGEATAVAAPRSVLCTSQEGDRIPTVVNRRWEQ